MNKSGLRFLAAVLTTGIIVVPFLGLDNLPRELRSRIDTEQKAYTQARTDFARARQEVEQDLHSDPELFRAHDMNTAFPERFRKAEGVLAAAGRDMAALSRLRQADRRGDRAEAERLLNQEQRERRTFASEATQMRDQAAHWVHMKQDLPGQLQQMQRDYQALHAADLGGTVSLVEKAAADWPGKKADLEARLAALRATPPEAEKTWQASEPLRQKAAARDYAGLDYAALLTAAESLHQAATDLPAKSQEVKGLAGQLYTSWDKVLVDLDGSGGYKEKLRTVRTRMADASGQKADVTTDEKWVEVSRAEYRAAEKNLGMAVEHKAAGKYDYEAERTAQPAGFAYMASPDQGRNQYGYWDRRDGQSFWVWYGQYALLRDLLFNRDYRPLDRREWDNYRQYNSRGQTYYGRDAATQAPKYGTAGSDTQSRYSGSTFGRRGGFRDSEYAAKGGYRGSQYGTGGFRRGESGTPRTFGSRPSSPSRSWSPPRSSPRPSFGGGGRSFGRRR